MKLRPSGWLIEALVAALLAWPLVSAVSGWRAADAANALPGTSVPATSAQHAAS